MNKKHILILIVILILLLLFLYNCSKKTKMMLIKQINSSPYQKILVDSNNYILKDVARNQYSDISLMIKSKNLSFVAIITKFLRYKNYDVSEGLILYCNQKETNI